MFLPVPRKSAYRARKDGYFPWLMSVLRLCTTAEEADEFWNKYGHVIREMPEGWEEELRAERDRIKGCDQVVGEERERIRRWRLMVVGK